MIRVKNQFKTGKIIDILQPNKNPIKFKVKRLISADNNTEMLCANPNDIVIITDLGRVDPFSIFRIKN